MPVLQIRPPGPAVLDDLALTTRSDADTWEVGTTQQRTVVPLATGRPHEDVLYTAADLPEMPQRRTWGLAWSSLPSEIRDPLLWRLARPGEHTLALWLDERVSWRGNGARTDFRLRHGWRVAIDLLAPPSGRPTTAYELDLALADGTPSGDPVPVTPVDAATWDAGPPAAGTAHRLRGTDQLRLGTAPAVGQALWGKVVPLYRCVQAPVDDRQQIGPARTHPYRLELVETWP